MSVLFATTRRNDMRPLAFQGIFATNCYDQLRAYLAQNEEFLAAHGMPNAASFLAEPMHDASGTIDWYAEGNVEPVPFSSLGEVEQQMVMDTLNTYASALQALLAKAQGNGMAEGLLHEALQHPGPDDLYVQNGAPILINWGFAPGVQGAVPQDIMRLGGIAASPVAAAAPMAAAAPAAAPVAAAPVAAPVAASIFPGCLSWLLPLLLLLLLLWLLLAALGHLPSPLPSSCFRQSVSMDSELLRKQSLEDDLARLLRQLDERAALCVPKTPPKEDLHAERKPVLPDFSTPVPEPEPEIVPEDPVTPPSFGVAPVIPEEPKVETKPEPKVVPKPEPKPAPKPEPKPVPRNSKMEIPKDAAKKKDLTFLEGCWRSKTDLFNTRGEPIEGEYCFNKNGTGRRFVYEKNGQRCSGAARARFSGNRLIIEAPEASCPRGGGYVAQDVTCTGSESSTQCRGQEHSRNRNKWKATFLRK